MALDPIDTRQVRVRPLADRRSKHALQDILIDPDSPPPAPGPMAAAIELAAERIYQARARGAAVVLAYGAHLIKNGLGPVATRLVQGGWVTHLATHGAGTIHDWEYAFWGESEEDVQAHVARGCFGTWDETGRFLNLAVLVGSAAGLGYGASLGRFIVEEGLSIPRVEELVEQLREWLAAATDNTAMPARAELLQSIRRHGIQPGWLSVRHPHGAHSLTAAAWRAGVPLTVHPGIGYDIIYTHPLANGAALGRAAHHDFGVFTASVARLDGGVLLSVGSAVMAPQVFEKAMSIANNLRAQAGQAPLQPFILVNDLAAADWPWGQGEPPADHPAYYLRFCKSYSRMGGEARFAQGDNRVLLRNLYHLLRHRAAPGPTAQPA